MALGVKLEIFEGPLDLLLHLIRKNEVDIYDIPVALITGQYLEYLNLMRDLNIEMAGDFLLMASTLSHIKSRMLLPSRGSGEDGEEEDPRVDLVAQLTEYMRIKEAAARLGDRPRLERDIFARGAGRRDVDDAVAAAGQNRLVSAGLFELIEAFRRVMSGQGRQLTLSLPRARVSLEDRMGQVLDLLREKRTVVFDELFPQGSTRDYLVVTFLSLLELTRVGMLKVYQQWNEQGWSVLRIFLKTDGGEDD